MSYVLIEHLRREGLKGTELAKAQVNTIRPKLFKIAARVVVTVRRVVLHLSSGFTVHVEAAPGTGSSVSFDWILMR